MRRTLVVACGLLAIALEGPFAQSISSFEAQLERIFKTREYDAPRFGPARWLADGSSYTVLERTAAGASEIVRYEAVTGSRTVLVPAARLVPPGGGPPLEIEDYSWSADGRRLLIFTNTSRVWRQNTRGDYWVLDLPGDRLTKIGAGAAESTLMFAKFSPDGTRVAYVRQNDLYVEDLEAGPGSSGRIVRLTSDGSDTTINGTSDWVYEEELGVRDGFRWSPDGRRIAYWQFDTAGVGVFTLINSTDSMYPTLTRIPYPKVGTTNSAVRIGVVEAARPSTPRRAGAATRWIRTPGDPRENYLARMEWIGDGEVSIQQLNRLQNRNDLLIASADSGEVRRAFRDESSTWVEVVDEVRWIDDGRAFLWLSERSGWQHVYRVPRDGGEPASLTRFDADVIDVAGVDEKSGWIYFTASPRDAARRYLYRSRLDGTGSPIRVTGDQPGTHAYTIAPGAQLAFHTYSRFDRPPAIDLVDLPAHTSLRKLTDPATLEQTLKPIVEPPVEFFTVGVDDGVTLDGWMLKPASFDGSKRYPVIVFVYGEPAGQTVTDRWGGSRALFHRALANAGYVVLTVDNRGTPAPKGTTWRKVVYGSVGDLSSKEQAAAIRALTRRHRFLDPDRVGIWGWSGGGTNTLNALFRFPDIYKVGVSVAPVPDQQLYDTIYQERYMGLPKDNADGYRRGSAINFADGLKGRLLLVHGSGDDNVHYQGTERLVNRLVALGKPFDLMVYPNRSHAIGEGAGTTLHVHALIARHFLEHLPAGPR
jgi:dipeptidyl-peptidase-4